MKKILSTGKIAIAISLFATATFASAALKLDVRWAKNSSIGGASCYLYANDQLANFGEAVDENLCRYAAPTNFEWDCSLIKEMHCYEIVSDGPAKNSTVCQEFAAGTNKLCLQGVDSGMCSMSPLPLAPCK